MKKIITCLILIILFTIDLILIKTNNISWLDNSLYNLIISLESNITTNIFKVITFFASVPFMISINIIIFIYSLISKKYKHLLINIASITSVIINYLTKNIIRRTRPSIYALVTETGFSFPSAHSMISVLFYGMIIYVLLKHKPKYYPLYISLLVILIILVGISRIYLGVHYPSDVLGGYLLSSFLLIIITSIYERKFSK